MDDFSGNFCRSGVFPVIGAVSDCFKNIVRTTTRNPPPTTIISDNNNSQDDDSPATSTRSDSRSTLPGLFNIDDTDELDIGSQLEDTELDDDDGTNYDNSGGGPVRSLSQFSLLVIVLFIKTLLS